MKNRLIRWLIALFKLCRKPSTADSFLIVSTTGMGDSLWGSPALRTLREAHPDAYIALLTNPVGEEIYRHNPHLSEIFTLRKTHLFSFARLFFKMRKKRIGTAFIFHTSQRPVLPFCFLIGIGRIVGTEGINKGLDFLLTDALPQKKIHEIERRMEIVGEKMELPYLEIFPSREERERVLEFLHRRESNSFLPLVGLHPGAKDRFKRWPKEHFATVGHRLEEAFGCQIFVTGSSEESTLVNEVASQIPGAIPLAGEFSVGAFAAFLQHLSLFITNDTGPMHLSFATNTPTIALFSPTDPKICGPHLAAHAVVLSAPRACTPCVGKKCKTPFCMMQIGPDQVFKTALDLAPFCKQPQEEVYDVRSR